MKITVTVLDTTGIQPYIFGSNRLRENIGASYLVSRVTDDWGKQELVNLKIPNPEGSIEDQNAELVYAGGGNTVLLFKSHDLAKEFTQRLSLKVLKEAPGINLVVAHREIEWDVGLLYQTVQDMMANDLDVKKRSRIPSSPLLGLGVTADCQSTRLVAVDKSSNIQNSPGDYPVSREIVAKLKAVSLANKDLKQTIFDPKVPNPWDIPRDFDDFGRSKGEMSYIAVVHIDGNSMGETFKNCGKSKSDRDYITAIRKLSGDVEDAGRSSLEQLTKELIGALPSLAGVLKDLSEKMLPFRPLVYGGDDVTFVCDGRLGLSLAARYLQIFEEKTVVCDEKQIPLTACAGVCIVKAHYPFARAYEMSEALCKSAKGIAKFERESRTRERSEILSAIDWHITSSGLLGGIAEIREREYRSQNNGKLEMRPLLLNSNRYDWQTWESFSHIIKVFEEDEWKGKQNKVKALREVLRRGADATKEFITAYRIGQLPGLPASVQQIDCRESLEKSGWYGDTCGYFDAIEAIDFYLPLGGES
jgi:hypothetical protein